MILNIELQVQIVEQRRKWGIGKINGRRSPQQCRVAGQYQTTIDLQSTGAEVQIRLNSGRADGDIAGQQKIRTTRIDHPGITGQRNDFRINIQIARFSIHVESQCRAVVAVGGYDGHVQVDGQLEIQKVFAATGIEHDFAGRDRCRIQRIGFHSHSIRMVGDRDNRANSIAQQEVPGRIDLQRDCIVSRIAKNQQLAESVQLSGGIEDDPRFQTADLRRDRVIQP